MWIKVFLILMPIARNLAFRAAEHDHMIASVYYQYNMQTPCRNVCRVVPCMVTCAFCFFSSSLPYLSTFIMPMIFYCTSCIQFLFELHRMSLRVKIGFYLLVVARRAAFFFFFFFAFHEGFLAGLRASNGHCTSFHGRDMPAQTKQAAEFVWRADTLHCRVGLTNPAFSLLALGPRVFTVAALADRPVVHC